MTSCHTYNPLSAENRKIITAIANSGFEIGLHFNSSIYDEISKNKLIKKIDHESAILSSIIGQKVKSISQHRPFAYGQYLLIKGFRNAYDPKVFSEDRYISDSHMEFQKDIFKFLKNPQKFPLQILLHPFQYDSKKRDYRQIIDRFMGDFVGEVDKDFRRMTSYKRQVEAGELKEYIFYHKKDR